MVKQDITEEEWNAFHLRWKRFKRCTLIPAGQEADQLYDCCEKSLGRLLIKENPAIIEAGEAQLLEAIKAMAVVKVAVSVRRSKLFRLRQEHGQSFREFCANVKAQANTCDFSVQCPSTCCKDLNKPNVDYTSHIVKDILICGVADNEIRKSILELDDLDNKTDKDIVGFVESKEAARLHGMNRQVQFQQLTMHP